MTRDSFSGTAANAAAISRRCFFPIPIKRRYRQFTGAVWDVPYWMIESVSEMPATSVGKWNSVIRVAKQRSLTFQESQVERRENQNDSDVHHQPLPEPVPKEQNVHADHDGDQREHVKHDDFIPSHALFLLRVAARFVGEPTR
jgi:hypothetical protein